MSPLDPILEKLPRKESDTLITKTDSESVFFPLGLSEHRAVEPHEHNMSCLGKMDFNFVRHHPAYA